MCNNFLRLTQCFHDIAKRLTEFGGKFKSFFLILIFNFVYFQDSLNDTYGDLKVPVPVTLIHHDGTHLTTRQIMSMESLREVIRKHEKVPMDDPQDRGDLYLLAPMRLLLSPIAEETESSEAPSQINETTGQDFNKYVDMTNV